MAVSSTSRTRATNLTGLIDIDALVEANLIRQKTKLNSSTQKLKVEEYRQEQYREIQSKAKKFYNKYFDVLSSDSLFNSKTYNTMKATSSDANSVTATASTEAKAGTYKVNITQVATSAQCPITLNDLEGISKITIDDNEFILNGDAKSKASDLISQLEKAGIGVNAKYSDFTNNGAGGVIIQKEAKGSSATLKVNDKEYKGTDIVGTITDMSTGADYDLNTNKDKMDGNSITLDGVKFNLTDKTNGDVTISVKADGTELKDKIVEFINDYNELLGSINTKLYEKYDKSYLPLTDEDKEGLSDSEIEKLEKKAQTGLLRNDSYLSNFADDMKMTMASVMKKEWGGSSVGLSLEKIGIKPVQDYKAQNGLFTIDEDKLLEAIESNINGVKELFTRGMANSSSSESDGIFVKLKNNLHEHATGTFSRLANRAGVADGVTATTNEMTKDIEQRKKLIAQMQVALKEKEDALYIRYSSLESSLASLQSQQSSLSSYFQ